MKPLSQLKPSLVRWFSTQSFFFVDQRHSKETRGPKVFGSIWLKNMQAANFIGNRTRNKNSKFWVLAPLYLGNGKSHTKYASMLKKRYFYKEHEERVVEK
jgi:hypothetical protein